MKYFAFDSVSTIGYTVVPKDGFLFVSGALVDTSYGAAIKSYMAKFDYHGNLIWEHEYRPAQFLKFYFVNLNDMIITSDGGMVAAGTATDTNGVDSILLTKFDASGNMLYYKTYAPDFANYMHTYGFQIIEYDSSFFILADLQRSDYYVALVLLKTDLQGNLQFIKTYQNLPLLYGSETGGLCKLPDNKLLLVNGRTDGNVYYWETVYSTCFLVADTGGTVLQQYCTSDSDAKYYQQVGTTYDGNYLSCGSYYQLRGRDQPTEMDINYLAKLDTNFDTIWQLKAGPAEGDNTFTDFKQDANNNIYLCGSDYAPPSGHGAPKGSLTKVSPDGAVQCIRYYIAPTGLATDLSYNYLSSISLLPNGNIAAVGTWQSSTNTSPLYYLQTGILLVVDSNGCLNDTDCGLPTAINEPPPVNMPGKKSVVNIFPNPSNGIFTVNTNATLPAATTIDVYNALGRRLQSQLLLNRTNLLNLYYLPPGIYFYKITNGLINIDEGKLVIQR